MSTKALLREFDALVMAGSPLFDRGTYTPPGVAPGATPVVVDVKLDRDLRSWGEEGLTVATYDSGICIQLSQVAAPAKGGKVTLADGEAFTLCDKLGDDGSLQTWGARHG